MFTTVQDFLSNSIPLKSRLGIKRYLLLCHLGVMKIAYWILKCLIIRIKAILRTRGKLVAAGKGKAKTVECAFC